MITTDITLYPFQEEARDLCVGRGSSLIALTMGAGKTLVTISAIEDLADEGQVRHGLIIVPASLKFQWQREILRFTGHRALVIDGDPKSRQFLYRFHKKFRYTIMAYSTVVGDWAPDRKQRGKKYPPSHQWVRDMDFDFIAIDEATAIKNPTTKTAKNVKFLGRRTDFRFALTGQPVENKPEELFSIMEFVDPEVLGDPKEFDRAFIVRDDYGNPRRYRNLHIVKERLEGVMYRKTRADIAKWLPRVIPNLLPFNLSAREQALYMRACEYTLGKLEEALDRYGTGFNVMAHYGHEESDAQGQMKGDIMAGMLMMRQICDDPNLVIISARKYKMGKGDGSKLAAQFLDAGLLERIPERSTKRDEFVAHLADALGTDPAAKVVAFSTFKDLLHGLQADTAKVCRSVQFTGDMNARQKDVAKQEFKTDKKCRLFLSSDAGGYGVDIPEANFLTSLDLPWSTGSYEQRESRIIRISSEWDHVNIGMMLAKGSIEMRMYEMIEQKKGVADAFLDGKYDEKGSFSLTMSTLRKFLEETDLAA